jgi:hypothetical protein
MIVVADTSPILLGVLSSATTLNLIDLPTTLDRLLHETNFRVSPILIQKLLDQHDNRF